MLDDFFFSPDGQLDRLVLENVSRRPMSQDKTRFPPPAAEGCPAGAVDTGAPTAQEFLQRFYPVDGDYFVLPMSEALTLNVQYM
jgi:hypothetical protein